MAPTSILFYKEVGHSQEGAQEVVSLFGDKGVFDGPKPVRLLQRLITLANLKEDSIVLDFFSGSASTAHALMKTNSEKDKHCQFILVQLPEEVSDSKKDQGYKNICEIGKNASVVPVQKSKLIFRLLHKISIPASVSIALMKATTRKYQFRPRNTSKISSTSLPTISRLTVPTSTCSMARC